MKILKIFSHFTYFLIHVTIVLPKCFEMEVIMGFIDLHVHSNASDGTMSPAEVVVYAASKKLDAIALTDHDTIDGIAKAALTASQYALELIPGIEMSCMYGGTEIHILGLYVDVDSPALTEGLASIRRIRDSRNQLMLSRFQEDGFAITREDLLGGHPDTVITRSHFAKVLTEKNYTATRQQAFDRYLQYGDRYCTRKEDTTPETAMGILRSAGAFPVLAHPLLYNLGYDQIEMLILELKELGLCGLEVYHSSNNQHQSGKLKQIAIRHHLLPTGGSDFHGANKPDIDIGSGRGGLRISHLLLNDIKEAHHGRILSGD